MQKDKVEEKDQVREEEVKQSDVVDNQAEQEEKSTENKEAASPSDAESEPQSEAVNDANEKQVESLQEELAESKDKYLRLYSEFENFRRRTSRERLELIDSANKDLIENLVPVLDDFERALDSIEESAETASAKEGTKLIYNKFKKVLESKGLKKMDIKKGDDFNDDFHEAITQIPAEEKLAGKIVDVIENGYFLGEKVVRFAKVVTGAKS